MGAISSDIYNQIGLGVQQQSRNENLGQADFLRLMTEQLKNQDPLKPLSNNEFLGQLAQFSTVQGIQDLNAGFGGLQTALGGDQVLRAASLVGHEVLVPSDRVQLVPGQPAEGLVATPSAGTVVMDIKDASGQLVRRLEIPSPGAGDVPFSWDGRDQAGNLMPAGTYTISATQGVGQQAVALETGVVAAIQSVSVASNGLYLNLAGLGTVPLESVRRIGG